jgi:hypothetical protein
MLDKMGVNGDNTEFLKNSVLMLTKKLQDKDEKIKQLQKEMLTNNDSCEKIVFEKYKGDDETSKKVVKLYAQGYSSGYIFDILNKEVGVSASMGQIEDIVRGIDGDKIAVSNDLLAYYIECRKVFEDQENLSKGLFAQTIYKKMKILEENYSQLLVRAREAEDDKEARLILDSLLKLTEKTATIFSKNILDMFNNNSKNNAVYSEEYKKLKDKYLAQGKENRKVLKIKNE